MRRDTYRRPAPVTERLAEVPLLGICVRSRVKLRMSPADRGFRARIRVDHQEEVVVVDTIASRRDVYHVCQ